MEIIQVLKEYSNRTEYKVLAKFFEVDEVRINELDKGILVLPGILLYKMQPQEIEILNIWIENPVNQLILTPTWTEIDIKKIFNTSVDLSVVQDKGLVYEELPCQYKIKGKVTEVCFQNDYGKFGIHYRRDTGTGILTIITVPLFDYKLSSQHDKLHKLFMQCIVQKNIEEAPTESQEDFVMNDIHVSIILLIAAGYKCNEKLWELIKKFFAYDTERLKVEKAVNELIDNEFITQNQLSEKSYEFIKVRNLKSFINVLKEGRVKNEW